MTGFVTQYSVSAGQIVSVMQSLIQQESITSLTSTVYPVILDASLLPSALPWSSSSFVGSAGSTGTSFSLSIASNMPAAPVAPSGWYYPPTTSWVADIDYNGPPSGVISTLTSISNLAKAELAYNAGQAPVGAITLDSTNWMAGDSYFYVIQSPAALTPPYERTAAIKAVGSLTVNIAADSGYTNVQFRDHVGIGSANTGHFTINDQGSKAVIEVGNAGDIINLSPSSHVTLNFTGSNAHDIGYSVGSNVTNFAGASTANVVVSGFVHGHDQILLDYSADSSAGMSYYRPLSSALPLDYTGTAFITAGAAKIPALTLNGTQSVVIDLGAVGSGDIITVAANAAAAYKPSATGADNVGLYFIGHTSSGDSSGDSVIYSFNGDTHGTVTAGDLVKVATITGVSQLTAADFYSPYREPAALVAHAVTGGPMPNLGTLTLASTPQAQHDVAAAVLMANPAVQSESTADFLSTVYHNALGRAPDAGGFTAWSAALSSGQVDKATALIGIATSAEASAYAHGSWLQLA